jgi:hypothetical protein
MPGPRLQRAATVWPELIQPRIRNRIFLMKLVYITHAVHRQISLHLLMHRPRLHDVLCDPMLWR